MTKTVRIENADTGNWPVRVTVQHKDAEGNWIDQPGSVQLDLPTMQTSQYLTSHRRLVVEERAAQDHAADPTPGTYLNNTELARVCHEVNRAYCAALGDHSQPAWKDAPDWQRSRAALGVKLHTENDVGPEASHKSWTAQKVSEGWAYGDVKDPEAKTHSCILPFDKLPPEQQAKDFIFRAVVHALRKPADPVADPKI